MRRERRAVKRLLVRLRATFLQGQSSRWTNARYTILNLEPVVASKHEILSPVRNFRSLPTAEPMVVKLSMLATFELLLSRQSVSS